MKDAERVTAVDLLGQGEIWVDSQGTRHEISGMEPRYVRHVRDYLLRNGRALAEQAYHRVNFGMQPSGDVACHAVDSILEELLDAIENPTVWLERSELVQALDARLAPPQEAVPATGGITRDTRLDEMMVEFSKEKKPEERGLLQTLLALDVPVERAVGLVTGETTRAVKGELAQLAWLIRESRMNQFPEDSEVYRRLGMIADMLDPSVKDSWEYPRRG